jgi:hypothetical protein
MRPPTRSPDARFGLYSRYAALVGEQEGALAAGDLDRFGSLSDERERLQLEVDALPEAAGPPPHEAREALALLRTALEHDRRIAKRLGGLRDEARTAVRSVERRGEQARRYLERGGPLGAAHDLDVRL